jgi:hypothetical protein
LGTEQESDPERDRRRCVAKVVNQVGKERDAAAGDKDRELDDRRQAKDREREANGPKSGPRALDAVVYEAVRVSVCLVTAFVVLSPPRMCMRT